MGRKKPPETTQGTRGASTKLIAVSGTIEAGTSLSTSKASTRRDQKRLLDCPTEILDLIIKATYSVKDKYCLCLVNHRLRKLAQILLFEEVDLLWTKHRTPPIALFIRTLLECPHLAGEVRHLRLLGTSSKRRPTTSDSYLPKRSWIKEHQIRNAIQSTDLDDQRKLLWTRLAIEARVDALIGLLLLQLKNLVQLHISGKFATWLHMIGFAVQAVLAETGTGAVPLHKLNHIMVIPSASSDPSARDDNINAMLHLFELPSIRLFQLSLLNVRNPSSRWLSHTSNFATLQYLYLDHISAGDLSEILKQTPGLEILHWVPFQRQTTISYESSDAKNHEPIDLYALAEGLGYVGATLNDLVITTAPYPRPRFTGTLGAVWKHMRCLEGLTIPSTLITVPGCGTGAPTDDEETLPRSLCFVTLTDAFEQYDQVDYFAAPWNVPDDFVCDFQSMPELCEAQSGYSVVRRWLRYWKALTPKLLTMELEIVWEPGTPLATNFRMIVAHKLQNLQAGVDLKISKFGGEVEEVKGENEAVSPSLVRSYFFSRSLGPSA